MTNRFDPWAGEGRVDPWADYTLPSPEKIIMQLDKIGLTQLIARGLHRMRFEKAFDNAMAWTQGEEMILRLSAYVMSEHLADDTVTDTKQVPATWWQHLKRDLSRTLYARWNYHLARPLRWWLDRHPVRTETITFSATWTRKATRPQSKIKIHDSLGPVVYQEQVSTRWSNDDVP